MKNINFELDGIRLNMFGQMNKDIKKYIVVDDAVYTLMVGSAYYDFTHSIAVGVSEGIERMIGVRANGY